MPKLGPSQWLPARRRKWRRCWELKSRGPCCLFAQPALLTCFTKPPRDGNCSPWLRRNTFANIGAIINDSAIGGSRLDGSSTSILIRDYRLLREVQCREFAMVLYCRPVVCFSGVYFFFEVAEEQHFVVEAYLCGPYLTFLFEADAFVF